MFCLKIFKKHSFSINWVMWDSNTRPSNMCYWQYKVFDKGSEKNLFWFGRDSNPRFKNVLLQYSCVFSFVSEPLNVVVQLGVGHIWKVSDLAAVLGTVTGLVQLTIQDVLRILVRHHDAVFDWSIIRGHSNNTLHFLDTFSHGHKHGGRVRKIFKC